MSNNSLSTIHKLIDLDYEWLTGWKGPPGAAYNVIYEDLKNAGYIKVNGEVTDAGRKAIKDYEISHGIRPTLGV